jgi:hypothetical protein
MRTYPDKVLNRAGFFISYKGRKKMNEIIPLSMIGMLLLGGAGVGAMIPMNTSTNNHAPEAPTIDGPVSVKVGNAYTWSFHSTDPDGDNITYYVDWGDECGGAEWHGPFPSGETIEMEHTYMSKNTLLINSLVVDENGAESNMTYFEVNISKSISLDGIFYAFLRAISQYIRISTTPIGILKTPSFFLSSV